MLRIRSKPCCAAGCVLLVIMLQTINVQRECQIHDGKRIRRMAAERQFASLEKLVRDFCLPVFTSRHTTTEGLKNLCGVARWSEPAGDRKRRSIQSAFYLRATSLLRRLRANKRNRLVLVVILTTSNEQQDRLNGYGLGAKGIVPKAVQLSRLIEAVSQLGLWLPLNEPPPAKRSG